MYKELEEVAATRKDMESDVFLVSRSQVFCRSKKCYCVEDDGNEEHDERDEKEDERVGEVCTTSLPPRHSMLGAIYCTRDGDDDDFHCSASMVILLIIDNDANYDDDNHTNALQ